ncbi:MAG: C40 family peptidase [Gemmatimonadaceae bacterium]|nr:C40 family peptidase [Gemmatimonadaceae bacterium]NUQ92253.1 C40 family peptidase [Gemmatimonadaceae bacterium]NUR18845.1 C40 family peptidase [Gemmatimonadaceae bacterium]NUS99310.1 C40 family peptidase [Gemmatimonadaceae bacterium]
MGVQPRSWIVAPRRDAFRVLALAGSLLALSGASAGAQQVSDRGQPRGTIAVRGTVTGTDIVRAARQYLGVRYKWGGTTPRAFDCSGFTRWVFARYGIELPRTAHEQAAFGAAPFPGDLRPGDLLFFYGGQGAQHIAIYVGADTIIHASSTGHRVKLDVIKQRGSNRNWFRNRLIAVRRIVPMQGTFYIPGSATAGAPPHQASLDEAPRTFRLAPTVY